MSPRLLALCAFSVIVAAGCTLSFDRLESRGCDETCSDCCASDPIPGGTFDRGNDQTNERNQPPGPAGREVRGFMDPGEAPATVSDFVLDRFEVTRARFARFVETYDEFRARGLPNAGDGATPGAANSGWRAAYDASLPPDASALIDAVSRCPGSTWLVGDPREPMDCVDWYIAHAFCIWDEGRLPSEAEWNYAAAGGDEQRAFPWSNPPSSLTIDDTYVVNVDTDERRPVGSVADRDAARWGTHDLAGNLREWTQDGRAGADLAIYLTPCVDCVDDDSEDCIIVRGGDFGTDTSRARTAHRSHRDPTTADEFLGLRCAREP